MKKFSFINTFLIPFAISGIFLSSCKETPLDTGTTIISKTPSILQSSTQLADTLLMIKYNNNIYYSAGIQIDRQKFDSIKGLLLGTTSTIETDDINTISNIFENNSILLPDLASNIASPVKVYSVNNDPNEIQLIAEIDNATYELFEKLSNKGELKN